MRAYRPGQGPPLLVLALVLSGCSLLAGHSHPRPTPSGGATSAAPSSRSTTQAAPPRYSGTISITGNAHGSDTGSYAQTYSATIQPNDDGTAHATMTAHSDYHQKDGFSSTCDAHWQGDGHWSPTASTPQIHDLRPGAYEFDVPNLYGGTGLKGYVGLTGDLPQGPPLYYLQTFYPSGIGQCVEDPTGAKLDWQGTLEISTPTLSNPFVKQVVPTGSGAHLVASVSDTETIGPETRTATVSWNLIAYCEVWGELSGAGWVQKFPGSSSLDDLEPRFQEHVRAFQAALTAAGVPAGNFAVASTRRPQERQWLMHHSWRIVKGSAKYAQEAPSAVPDYPEQGGFAHVWICWMHRDSRGRYDPDASVAAAQQMTDGYHITNQGGVGEYDKSRHRLGLAVDWTFHWTVNPLVVQAPDGPTVTIDAPAGQRNDQNPAVWDLGARFGVCKLRPPNGGPLPGGCLSSTVHDPPHWSDNGR